MKIAMFGTMLAGLLCVPAGASAGQAAVPRDLSALSLEELLQLEVVSTASKFPQEVRQAPASVTVVTAEDIRRHGHRTLADILRSVRGFYTSYDRNYGYLGTRGFSRPGDYNTRVLVLVDGQRMNDALYDYAPIGTDFPLDVSMIEKIEIVRGPGSALYGTNALFAVINIVTATGSQRPGVQVEAAGGSLATAGGAVSYGATLGFGRDVLLGASTSRSEGARELYFPDLDRTAVGLDDDRVTSVFGAHSSRRFSVRGGMADRRKVVPTASWGTVFGDGRETTTDVRAFLQGKYEGPIGAGWTAASRVAYDYYRYDAALPTDYGDPGTVLWMDYGRSHTLGGEVTARRRVGRTHQISVGGEVRRQFVGHQWAEDIFGRSLDVSQPGTMLGVYVQDEARLLPWLIASAGVRIDRYASFGAHTTPRAALVLLPRAATAIKILHGRAFRAPNPYELYYYPLMLERQFTLEPEAIRSTDVVWEEYLSKRIRTGLTVFHYDADRFVEQRSLPTQTPGELPSLYYANGGRLKGKGIEAEVDATFASGFAARVSHSYVRAEDDEGLEYSNSPRHLSKASVQAPVLGSVLALEGQFVASRLTLGRDRLPGFFVSNAVLTVGEYSRVGLTVGVYNLLDAQYADPGAEEHAQRSIPRDGRTLLARVRLGF